MYQHLCFKLAILAMLGVIITSVDLHQHETGLHPVNQCLLCSLEQSVGNDFISPIDVQLFTLAHMFYVVLYQSLYQHAADVYASPIRAPPLS